MKKIILLSCLAIAVIAGARAQDVTPAPAPEPAKTYHEKIVESFGKNVVSVSGKLDPTAIKTKKYLFIYYSAHWCPPCRVFTPKLVQFYNDNYAKGDFDLVFISLDESQSDMNKYMKGEKMPWIGLKLNSKPAKALKFKCAGKSIPCLLLLDENDYVVAESHDDDGKYLGPNTALNAYEKIKKEEAEEAAKQAK